MVKGPIMAKLARMKGSRSRPFCGDTVLLICSSSSVLDCFRNVGARNVLTAGEVGDAARHLEHAMIAARRQTELTEGALQELFALRIDPTVLCNLVGAQQGVGLALPRQLFRAGDTHPVTHDRRRVAAAAGGNFGFGNGGD